MHSLIPFRDGKIVTRPGRENKKTGGFRVIMLLEKELIALRYLKQFAIILLISFCGEVLHCFIPIPVPASIYGLLLMLLALCTHTIKLSSVRETGKFLIEIMPIMFIPAAVGLLDSWGVLRPVWLPVAVITVVTTVAVMAVSGLVAQWVIRREKKEGEQ